MKTIGVIGLGSIGMRHSQNLIAMGHTVYGYDTSDEAFTMMDKRILVMPPDGVRMDGLIIATPTSHHAEQLKSLEWVNGPIKTKSYKPIFVEKPIADHLIEVPDNVVMVGNNLRFHSCVKKAKEWLAEGLIGKPLWANFTVAQHNTKYTDPVVLNWGAHEFDLALYLLGPATVTAAAGNDQIFDTCLLHEYGVPSIIHCDYVTQPEVRATSIIGEKGRMSLDLKGRRIIATIGKGEAKIDSALGGFDPTSWDQDYKDEMQAFIDLIDGKPVPHAATGEDGLHTLELILEAQRMANASA